MQVRRCTVVFVEPRERLDFDLSRLVAGGTGVAPVREWIALAAHLDEEILLDADEVRILGQLSPGDWMNFDALAAELDSAVLERLIGKGLLIRDTEDGAA